MWARLEAVQPVLMARDVAASVRFYERVGFTLVFADTAENPRYVGLRRDKVEIHLQWHEHKEFEHTGDRPTYRFVVAEVDGLYREFRDAGISENINPVADTAWSTREFHVQDPDGNGLQFPRGLPS